MFVLKFKIAEMAAREKLVSLVSFVFLFNENTMLREGKKANNPCMTFHVPTVIHSH